MKRSRFLGTSAGAALGIALPHAASAQSGDLGLPAALIAAAKKEGSVTPYEPFPTKQSKPMADAFTAQFGIPNQFFRAGQEALQSRLEAEIRGGNVLADTIGQSDLDVVIDMVERKVASTETRPPFWNTYPEKWRYPKLNNVAYAILSCNMCYNNKLVKPADAPKTWRDLISPQWKGKVVIPSPQYAGTGFALLATWVKLYGWDFIKALRANDTFVVQAVTDSDTRVIAGEKLVGIVNSHRGNMLLGQNAPLTILWPKETPPVALSYVHAILAKAPHPAAAELYRDFCLTTKIQSEQAKVGLWSADPKATQPTHIPHLSDVALTQLDWDEIRKTRASLIRGWRDIMT